ncbi:MAG: hypothetical protein II272_02630, partial [Oscillospiraceae bacterium]|nr:hypothetical protein [Oscillospiraceae bacterium]
FHHKTTHRPTAPIPHTKLHPSTNCLHIPLPLPSGGTSPGGRGKGLGANLKQCIKPEFNAPSIDAHRTLASPTTYRHPPSPWLSLRESCHEVTERAHRTDSIHRPPIADLSYRQEAPSARELSRSD